MGSDYRLSDMLRLVHQLVHDIVAIQRLVLRLVHDNPLSNGGGLDLKQTVHLIQRHRLGLGNEKVHKSKAAQRHAAKQEVHAEAGLTHAVDHVWRDARDDEGPQPVCHGSEELADAARALREHLRVDDPRRAVPAVDVDGRPEVDHDDGGDAGGGEGVRVGRGRGVLDARCDEGADDVHERRAADGAVDEELAAAPFVDEHREPEDRDDGFDDTEEARGQVDCVLGLDADGSEDVGAVVVDL